MKSTPLPPDDGGSLPATIPGTRYDASIPYQRQSMLHNFHSPLKASSTMIRSRLLLVCAGLAVMPSLWMRLSNHVAPGAKFGPPERRRLMRYRDSTYQGWKVTDPRTVALKTDAMIPQIDDLTSQSSLIPPLNVCGRMAPIPHEKDIQSMQRYAASCPLSTNPPEKIRVLLLDGLEPFGRTGNNLIEFLHAFQYARDKGLVVAITMGSWATYMITEMWMAIQDNDIVAWKAFVEHEFCVKIIFDKEQELRQFEEVVQLDTKDIFQYRREGWHQLDEYIEFQSNIIRALFRSYNLGVGVNPRNQPVRDMCSVLDAMFGSGKFTTKYSVIHSRSLEGEPGIRLLERIAESSGCDPMAALDMEPEYVKAILKPLGMLHYPILFITDNQRPDILEKLVADPDIGPNIRLIPQEASWVGGDITVAIMSDVFIGNPASSFSGFIAKSRVALGYDTNYLFRKKDENGEWVDVCDHRCIFDKRVMKSMA